MQKISDINIARKYALAAYDLAASKKEEARWEKDLKWVAELFENPDLSSFLKDPSLLPAVKLKVVERLVPKQMSFGVMELIRLLIINKRSHLASEIFRLYKEKMEEAKGIVRVDVISAIPLDEKTRKSLAEKVKSLLKREIHLESQVDPSIIGGLILKIGDYQVDGSVRTKLSRIKESLLSI